MRLPRQNIIFVVVLVLLIISIIYRVQNPFVQEEVEHLTYTGENNGKGVNYIDRKVDGESNSIVSIFLNQNGMQSRTTKDLFSIYGKIPDFNENTKSEAHVETVAPADEISGEANNNSDPVSKISNDLLSYRFYGTYKSKDRKAIFLIRDKMVLVASIGDRLYGKYLIEEIQDNYIRIKALDQNETIHIDMREFNNE